ARKSASGITRTHALPLNALYKAQLARASASPKRARSSDAGKVFSLNMTQEADRAWISYVERGAQLLAAGQPAEARRVAEEGFGYFRNASHVWPEAIAFIGSTYDWAKAKRMAEECKSLFPGMADSCRKAAFSPAEKADENRKTEKKAEDVMNRLFK